MTGTFFGFLFGVFIPYMARRFSKFMPATPGYALFRLIWPHKHVAGSKRWNNPQYVRLMKRYLMRSLGWGVVCAALSYASFAIFAKPICYWYMGFIWISLLLYEIDERMLLLPDILTVPLLIGGFCFYCFAPLDHFNILLMGTQLSALGAVAGYVLPVLASLFLVKKYPEAFGGGDIKLLAACGAWLGLDAIAYLILGSCIIFALMMALKRRREGAFGPAIVIASLVLVFF